MKWLAVLIVIVGCNKSTPSISVNPVNSCNQYKEKVLEAAVVANEVKDDIVYGFKTNEQVAIKFLKEYSKNTMPLSPVSRV